MSPPVLGCPHEPQRALRVSAAEKIKVITMPRAQPIVLVLWGERCDELVACTFVTVLRRAGVRVKLVGVTGRRNRGAHGLTLTPDLSLREALPLASHVAAVVIPCEAEALYALMADIQLGDFLRQAQLSQGRFVVRECAVAELFPVGRCIEYGSADRLIEVAEDLRDVLVASWRQAD